jgi:hypothetical protein
MSVIDGLPIVNLSGAIESLRAAMRVAGVPPIPKPVLLPIPIPIRPAVVTTITRGGTTIGFVITPFDQPAPTALDVKLGNGTLWVEATLFGAAFSSTPGFAGIPFSSGTMSAVGLGFVTFGAGNILVSPGETLRFNVAPAITPVAGPPGDPIGSDFLAGKLTPFPHGTVALAPSGASVALAGTGEATLYGQALTLTPAPSPTPTLLNFTTPHVSIPTQIAETTFTVARSSSPEVAMAGSAPIDGAGIVFPIFSAAPTALPQPADAWGIVAVVGQGLSATIAPLAAPLALAGAAFALTPARLVGLAANGAGRARESYLLWVSSQTEMPRPPTQPALALPMPQLTLNLVPGALVAFSADPSQEVTIANATLTAVLDRPLDASGQRISLMGPAIATRVHTAASITVDIGSALAPSANTGFALVAENALVPVGSPNLFLLSGRLAQGRISGSLSVSFPAKVIVPTFPDPYVAVFGQTAGDVQIAGVAVVVTWNGTDAPVSAVTIIPVAGAAAATRAAAPSPFQEISAQLLDVSTNADLWGIELAIYAGAGFSFSGLQLQAAAVDAAVFTVPGISWEPVVDATNPSVPQWLTAFSPDDGVPTTFLVAQAQPATIEPISALQQYQAAAGRQATRAEFTLPFGIIANLIDPGKPGGASYAIPAVKFPDKGLTGARVLEISAAPAQPLQANLPGTAVTGFNDTPPAYGAQVLGTLLPSVAKFWDADFGPGGAQGFIPIGRIDLSGYGTTLFSDWQDPSTTDIGVVRALFDVLVGRTAHEIITAQTWILPWCIRLQRTITFDRSDGGDVVKHDSGWRAIAPGQFELLTNLVGPVKSRLLAGPVQSLNNVRNIEFSETDIVTVGGSGGDQYIRCTLDADVAFDPTIVISANGLRPAPTAVGVAIQGYAAITVSTTSTLNPPVSPDAIIALMQQQGRVTGSIGCIAQLGAAAQKFTMTGSAIGAAVAAGPTSMLQTALFGTPKLPKDGQWSIARRPKGSNIPQPVAAGAPVPLTRGTSAGATPPAGPGSFAADCYRLLDPEDAQSVDAPSTFYSLLQGTGTSKTLFEHPLVNDAGNGLGFGNAPALADTGALLGVPSIFPDIGNVLQIPSAQGGLPIEGDGFKKTYTFGAAGNPLQPQPPDRSLLDIAIVHLMLSYAAGGKEYSGTLVVDATPGAPNWSLTLENLSFEAKVDGLGSDPLITVGGGFQAGASIKPGFTKLQIDYGSALNAVKDLLTGLSDLASSLGGSADLDVGFSGNTLTVQQGFTLAAIPLGFGEISNLGINLGFSATIPSSLSFSVGIGSAQDPFQWLVSPLAGTGAIVLGVQDGGPNVFIEAGLGVGLGIDLAVASGSASIVLSLSLDVGTTAVTIAATLTGNAQVDVLGGVASASLTLAAAIIITVESSPQHQADLAAEVSVGIHISICWVISISFDGSWGFSESIALN